MRPRDEGMEQVSVNLGSVGMQRRSVLGLASLALAPTRVRAAEAGPLAVGTSFARLFGPDQRGLAVDLLDEIFAPLGLRPRYEHYPWQRAQNMVQQGQAQILIGPYRTPEREGRLRFSEQPFYEDALVMFGRRGECAWQGDLTQLGRLRVATVQGWVYGPALDAALSGLRHEVVRDVSIGLKMLQLGRIDLLACNARNTQPVLEALRLASELQPCGPPVGQLRGHFAFPLGETGRLWQQRVDEGMRRLRASGRLQQLAARWQVALPAPD